MPTGSTTGSRLYSQLDSGSESNISPTGVFANVRYPVGPFPALKRRKTTGLNARFDRMLEDVNLCYQASPHRRGRSSGSSSISSRDVPKTPIDAYSACSDGRLAPGFSVIKMNHSSNSPSLKLEQESDMSSRVRS